MNIMKIPEPPSKINTQRRKKKRENMNQNSSSDTDPAGVKAGDKDASRTSGSSRTSEEKKMDDGKVERDEEKERETVVEEIKRYDFITICYANNRRVPLNQRCTIINLLSKVRSIIFGPELSAPVLEPEDCDAIDDGNPNRPDAPIHVTVCQSQHDLTIAWDMPSCSMTGFKRPVPDYFVVHYRTRLFSWTPLSGLIPGTERSFTWSRAVLGPTYHFRVVSYLVMDAPEGTSSTLPPPGEEQQEQQQQGDTVNQEGNETVGDNKEITGNESQVDGKDESQMKDKQNGNKTANNKIKVKENSRNHNSAANNKEGGSEGREKQENVSNNRREVNKTTNNKKSGEKESGQQKSSKEVKKKETGGDKKSEGVGKTDQSGQTEGTEDAADRICGRTGSQQELQQVCVCCATVHSLPLPHWMNEYPFCCLDDQADGTTGETGAPESAICPSGLNGQPGSVTPEVPAKSCWQLLTNEDKRKYSITSYTCRDVLDEIRLAAETRCREQRRAAAERAQQLAEAAKSENHAVGSEGGNDDTDVIKDMNTEGKAAGVRASSKASLKNSKSRDVGSKGSFDKIQGSGSGASAGDNAGGNDKENGQLEEGEGNAEDKSSGKDGKEEERAKLIIESVPSYVTIQQTSAKYLDLCDRHGVMVGLWERPRDSRVEDLLQNREIYVPVVGVSETDEEGEEVTRFIPMLIEEHEYYQRISLSEDLNNQSMGKKKKKIVSRQTALSVY